MNATKLDRWLIALFAAGVALLLGAPTVLCFFGPVAGLVAFFIAGPTFGVVSYRNLHASKATAPKNAIQELIDWKRQRRATEAREWQQQFDRVIAPIPDASYVCGGTIPVTILPAYAAVDLQMLVSNYGQREGYVRYSNGWDGLHHATCPWECDCPQEARIAYHRRSAL